MIYVCVLAIGYIIICMKMKYTKFIGISKINQQERGIIMNNVDKELPKALTIEELKNRVGKPVFVMATKEEFKHRTAWHILSKINAFKLDNESSGYVGFTDCKCIKFENIQFFRFFDTEVSATELKEILKEEEKAKKKTGYERVEGANITPYQVGLK